MRCKHDSSTTAAVSEVANAELSCYGVFRKLEPDGGGGGGGAEPRRVIAGRPPPRLPALPPPPSTPPPPSPPPIPTTTLPTAFSPQETASPYATTAVAVDYDDDGYDGHHGDYDVYGDFDRDTFSVYDDNGGVCCDTIAAATSTPNATTTITTKTGPLPSATGRRYRDDDDVPNDFGAVVWDDYGSPPAAVTGDLRGAVAGSAVSPFSHTPMGSTTKLVGIDANNDDSPKVRTYFSSICFFFKSLKSKCIYIIISILIMYGIFISYLA